MVSDQSELLSAEPIISIIIVNYNGKKFMDDCLAAIRKHVLLPHEVIVVDNASSDGSVDHLRNNHSEITLIESENNLGFACGNNLGSVYAKGKYVLLLNNDTVLCTDLSSAISLFEQQDDIGALGAKMLGRNQEYRYSAGNFPSPLKLLKISSLFRTDGDFANGKFDEGEVINVDWVEGSFILSRREIWEKLGGLDEGYFMYVEDVDYCQRIKQLGLRVVYFPRVSYIHYGGYGEGRLGMLIKGFRRYHSKFSNLPKKIISQMVLTFGLLARVVVNLVIYAIGRDIKRRNRAIACWVALKDSPW